MLSPPARGPDAPSARDASLAEETIGGQRLAGGRDAVRLRREAIELLRRATEADAAAYFDVVGPADRRVMTRVEVIGDRRVALVFQSFDGAAAPSGGAAASDEASTEARRRAWSLEAPLAPSRNRFQDSASGFRLPLEQLEHLDVVHRYRRPASIAEEYRALLFDGPRFLGWIGAIRCGRRPFSSAQRGAADRLLPRLTRLLAAARAVDGLATSCHLVLDGRGAILAATPAAAAWLSRTRLTRLEAGARLPSCEPSPPIVVDGVDATFVPMFVPSGPDATLVVLSPSVGIEGSTSAYLPHRQRQIAVMCVGGASVARIASGLGISTNTVKFHLKELYRRLGVRNRLELARELGRGG